MTVFAFFTYYLTYLREADVNIRAEQEELLLYARPSFSHRSPQRTSSGMYRGTRRRLGRPLVEGHVVVVVVGRVRRARGGRCSGRGRLRLPWFGFG